MKYTKTSPVLGNKDSADSITTAARANSPHFQSFTNENENLSKVCQTFRLLEQKVQQAFQTCQTCQTCRFRNLVANQTQIPSLPSLPFQNCHQSNTSLNHRFTFLRNRKVFLTARCRCIFARDDCRYLNDQIMSTEHAFMVPKLICCQEGPKQSYRTTGGVPCISNHRKRNCILWG